MFTLSYRGLRELDMRLRLMVARLRSDLPETMTTIAKTAAADARSMIGQERPEWPALAASTVREKRRLGFVGRVSPTDPLLRTGAMRSSIRGEGDAMVATVRANAPAKWQEQGTSNGHVPARPFIGPALKDAAPEALRLLAETFETAIRES